MAFGLSLGAFWLHLGLLSRENVKKVTFRSCTFSLGKTMYFVGLGGQRGANMAPRRAKMIPRRANMRQSGREYAKVGHRKAKDRGTKPRTRPRWANMGPRRRLGAAKGAQSHLRRAVPRQTGAKTQTPGAPRKLLKGQNDTVVKLDILRV